MTAVRRRERDTAAPANSAYLSGSDTGRGSVPGDGADADADAETLMPALTCGEHREIGAAILFAIRALDECKTPSDDDFDWLEDVHRLVCPGGDVAHLSTPEDRAEARSVIAVF